MEEEKNVPGGGDGIPPGAEDFEKTPVDYIVVGSGAGGGPLAARLARNGMRVLVLEAGGDSGAPPREPDEAIHEAENQHLIYHCPGLHAAATEPHVYGSPSDDASLGFRVRHFTDDAWQDKDSKACDDVYAPGKKAVLYPRAAAVGGCTAHHAMISIYGADYDWQKIADLTGDDSWAPGKMRAIYQRIERARVGRWNGWLLGLRDRLLHRPAPGRSASGDGDESGWLDVQTSDPKMALGDSALLGMITRTIFDVEELGRGLALWRMVKRLLSGRFFRDLDLNDLDTLRTSPEGVALVPLSVSHGVRRGPREHLLETQQRLRTMQAKLGADEPCVGELRIATHVFVRRVVFAEGTPPRAVGVEISEGSRLYDPARMAEHGLEYPKRYCYARREILLCGGAFNTPQLLMLSGIGDRTHLLESGVEGMAGIGGRTHPGFFNHLPGVGGNLRDRCEISVISELERDFDILKKSHAGFDPNKANDKALDAWRANPRSGLYTTNGAAIAILKRSPDDDCMKPKNLPPDVLILGFPAAFRGYYPQWSKDLLRDPRNPGDPPRYNLWSWTILKAYSVNCGSVRLRSNNPFEPPIIDFSYFGECTDTRNDFNGEMKNDDLAALKFGVKYVRWLNREAAGFMKGGDAAKAEIQPGDDRPDDSMALGDWIMQETWGHHAAGTCRIGFDPWQADPAALKDKDAVLDSSFRVHGVRGLRVVDASVFPIIPGYFIATPIYMISEKAADTILDELSR